MFGKNGKRSGAANRGLRIVRKQDYAPLTYAIKIGDDMRHHLRTTKVTSDGLGAVVAPLQRAKQIVLSTY